MTPSGFQLCYSPSSLATGRDFVVGPGYSPIPSKLVSKICSGLFVDLADLLPDNLKAHENEAQPFLEGKLVLTPPKNGQWRYCTSSLGSRLFSFILLSCAVLTPSGGLTCCSTNF